MTSKDIASKKFEKAKGFGGYKIDDVEDFMDRVAEYVERLEAEKRDMNDKLAVLADKLEEYRADEDSLRTALLGAQKLGDSVIKESKTKAEIILRDANIKAEKIIGEAHIRADEEQRRLESIKRSVSEFKKDIIALYRSHLETIIKTIPDVEVAAAPETEPVQEQEGSPAPEAQAEERTMEFTVVDTARQEEPDEEETAAPAREPVLQTTGTIKVLSTEEEEVRESKFGPLKFGDKFSLTRTDEHPTKRRR
ncbi:MAG: DivIVA domain-containing protein [Clostridiales bacterium]|nr:DivIVA domain-containing protein [Clostridiales bacterium]